MEKEQITIEETGDGIFLAICGDFSAATGSREKSVEMVLAQISNSRLSENFSF